MMDICIATFINGKETFSKDFLDLIEYLENESYDVKAYIFSNSYSTEIPKNIRQINMPLTTKYLRIMRLVQEALSDSILFVDNDITVDKVAIKRFISEYAKGNYALAWGRIGTTENTGFVPALIEIDKILSHNIIRPSLWRMGIGVSIPGQVFILNKKYFAGRMQTKDTVYDDLALGVVLKKYNFPYFMSKEYLGTEMPKKNIRELNMQRKRWAQGYAETVFNNKKDNVLKYVLVHGFAYHFLWIPVWGILVCMLVNKLYAITITLMLLLAYILSWGDVKRIHKAVLYMYIFPIIHLKWMFSFAKSLYNCFAHANK
ncbi:glycosyltransferase family 2 protein [Lachnospiraceae bacterium C1.1]|nr:glycosyltransferase family 2 protein [Lachnospiraceae bacterium C1.1]